jgi:large subunit ribosomal protein L15
MTQLSNLKDTHRIERKIQRVGRGVGSRRGKTCCRGHKGEGSRRGWKRMYTYEGGQMRLVWKLPCRGFTRGRFLTPALSLNLETLNQFFHDGEVINVKSLREKGFVSRAFIQKGGSIKILSNGKLEKKVTIEANHFSKEAIKKLEEAKISYKVIKT